MSKTITLVRLDEKAVRIVGYRYILRITSQAGYGECNLFTLTLADVINETYRFSVNVDWQMAEAALGEHGCWSTTIEVG
jgi:hypothetical protein